MDLVIDHYKVSDVKDMRGEDEDELKFFEQLER